MISKYTPEQIAHIKSYWYLCRYSFYILVIAFVVVGLIVLVEGYCPELKKKIEKMEHSTLKCIMIGCLTRVVVTIGSFIAMVSFAIMGMFTEPKQISLLDIRDKVTVVDNKLTIDPLDEEYVYTDSQLSTKEPHVFKVEIDDFFTDKPVQVTDKDGNSFNIPRDEFEKLKEGK